MIAVLILIAAIIGGGAFYLGAVGIAGAIAIGMSLLVFLCVVYANISHAIYNIKDRWYRRKLRKLRDLEEKMELDNENKQTGISLRKNNSDIAL